MEPLNQRALVNAALYRSNIENQKKNTEYKRKYRAENPDARQRHKEANDRYVARKKLQEEQALLAAQAAQADVDGGGDE